METGKIKKILYTALPLLCWLLIILWALSFFGGCSADELASKLPQSGAVTVLLILLMFCLKGVSVFIYIGLLYTLCAVLFPLPAAIALNICGTALAMSAPYLIGRYAGADIMRSFRGKFDAIEKLDQFEDDNIFMFMFSVRLIGLPLDLVSVYFGARQANYFLYILAGVLGMLPREILFSVMGANAENMSSPIFLLSAALLILISAGSVAYKKLKGKRA